MVVRVNARKLKIVLVLIACLMLGILLVKTIDSGALYLLIAIAYTVLGTLVFIDFIGKSNFSKSLRFIVLAGYFLRLLLDYSSANFIDFFEIFSPAGDSIMFYHEAYNLFLGSDSTLNLVYPKLLATVFDITGATELIAIYTSTVAWMLIVAIMASIFTRTKYNELLIATLSLMPVTIWINTSILREGIQILFLVMTTIYLLRWTDTGRAKYMIFSAIALLMATALHSGVVPIYASMILLYCIWSYKLQKWHIHWARLLISVLIIGIFILLLYNGAFDEYQPYITSDKVKNGILNYLANIYFETSNTTYLADFVLTRYNFIIWLLLKWLYFWISPVIWDAPSLMEWLIIVFDVVPILLIHYICIFKSNANRYVKMGFILTVPSSILYAIGTSASGTAMRHRNIFLAILIVCYIYGEKKAKEVNEQNII